MKSNIFLPKKIKVGFQERKDTYTGKLAYVIYYDQKNKLRKETSWEGWRNKSIEPQEFDNVPTSGFVLNKKVGGYSSGWDARQTYVRIYDPRNFEFEITVPNLLYILENATSTKGKGLEGDFVYGWDGKDLLLIPVEAPEYGELTGYNDLLYTKEFIKAKDLKVGATYKTKDNKELVYIGRFDYWETEHSRFYKSNSWELRYGNNKKTGWNPEIDDSWHIDPTSEGYATRWVNKGKRFYFSNTSSENISISSFSSISQKLILTINEECIEHYSNIFDVLEKKSCYSPVDYTKNEIVKYSLKEFEESLTKYGYYHEYYDNEFNLYECRCRDGIYSIKENSSKNTKQLPVTNYETIEELYMVVNPIYMNIYLANGRKYQRNY